MRRYQAARVSLPAWGRYAPTRCSYTTNASGVWQLMSWDLDSDAHTRLTDKPTGVAGGRPVPDGSAVVWFDDRAGDEVGRYVTTPFHGGPAQPLVPELADAWSAGLALRPNRLVVGTADAAGFSLHARDEHGLRRLYHHTQPAGVGGLSEDTSLLAMAHTEHGDVLHPTLRVLDALTGEAVAELWDGPGHTTAPAGWSPVAGDGRLAVLTDLTGKIRPEVWNPMTGDRQPLDLHLPGEVWVADWWPDASALLLGHNHLGRTALLRYSLSTHELVPLDLADGTIRGARLRDDGALWYAYNSSAKPSQVRVREPGPDGSYPAETDRALLVPPGEPAPDGVAYRSLHYDNGAGQAVHSFLATPEGFGPWPLVVDVHGGPHAQTTDSFDPEVQAWVDHGYAVLMPNYRGSTGYGKSWEDAVEGDPGGPELVDVLAGRERMIADRVADPDRTLVFGGSWGGYLVLLALGTQPDAWSAGVAVVPVADYISAYADEAPALREFDRSLFGGTPEEVPDLFRERSPITHVRRVRAPVLIITGANDTRCPQRQVDNYVAELERHGVPHHYHVFDAGHGSLDVSEQISHQALALDFLAEHLGTAPAQR